MIANSSLPGEHSSENPGPVAQTIEPYCAADNYCREHGGSVENLFPAIARDFKEMKAIKYGGAGDDFRDPALYRHLN